MQLWKDEVSAYKIERNCSWQAAVRFESLPNKGFGEAHDWIPAVNLKAANYNYKELMRLTYCRAQPGEYKVWA